MNMTHRVGEAADRLQRRRLEMKTDSLDRTNDDLERELRATRTQLEQERSTREQLLDALTSVPAGKEKVVVKKRRGRLLRTIVIGGGAYVLGARAGHERYEQIKGWAASMRDRVQSKGGELDDASEWAPTTNGGSDTRSQTPASSTPKSSGSAGAGASTPTTSGATSGPSASTKS